ncbi:acetyltransferase [Eikenella sp. NML96-A-049]|uniref:acyltransferase family protein n=1 Tax=unclassified Eikenella TaxID=2639367 RepID=UPI0007E1F470|nr:MULTISPECIES: acyltransferase family protein [unclassified Eikenella]OAM35334.1 acetyltransferase [Eikenella sp. NML070372]OAM40705.1 acetyltransferase [Eikenella sp. NML96-A-049]
MSLPASNSSLSYRADIDGLRAVAVIAVILFHIHAKLLPGGFLGVDIFFVISGYLITSIIHKELTGQRFSLLNFYQRRAKRILPAFLFVLAACTAVGAWLLMPDDFFNYLRSLRSSLFFGANLFFAKSGGYFDIASAEKPLLHIWSLSLEEQFYFVFPLLMWLVHKYLPKYTVHAVIAMIAASLLSGLVPYEADAYYLPQVRAYELLIGSLAAVVPARCKTPGRSLNPTAWLAAIVMLVCLCLPDGFLPGKGYIERLAVCSAAAWLIAAGNGSRFNQLLAWKPMVAVGLISYPLYLWHWPVLALLRYAYMDSVLPLNVVLVSMAGVVLASWVSYRLIENPIRHSKKLSGKAFASVMAVYFALGIGVNMGRSAYDKHLRRTPEHQNLGWHIGICNDGENNDCVKGDRNKPVTVLAVGDSHTAHYNTFYEVVGRHEGWAAYVVSAGSCAFLYNTTTVHKNLERPEWRERCLAMRHRVEQDLDKYQVVILSNRWQQRLEQPDFPKNFEKTLQFLLNRQKTVYVLKDNPNAGAGILRKRYLQSIGLFQQLTERQQFIRQDSEAANQTIYEIVRKYPQVHWIDFTDLVPSDFTVDGLPIYVDSEHFNPYGSEQMGKRFIASGRRLLQPLPDKPADRQPVNHQ